MPAGKACWKHKTQCAVHVGNSWLGRENDVANWSLGSRRSLESYLNGANNMGAN